ncbi:hypothetical protein MNB_SV-6-26 [hydrothermal vent metagenome]|uniref:Uncharacterized protein n=1 Tax=hydrothermal vent metagenome TaxID=652676 RepID=A0A1W1BHZ6_9ZZZZ
MKKYIISLGVMSSILFANVAIDEIDNMVEEIKAPRKGVALKQLSATLNPFVALQKETNMTVKSVTKKVYAKLTLSGIMNNKAYINGEWHSEGDSVSDYNLTHIGTRGVVLVKEKKIKKLFLHKKDDIIKMKDGR